MEHPVQKAIPAATVVIFRDQPEGGSPPQLLMVRRAMNMVFAAGAAVFPGGRVDADDHYLAKVFGSAEELDEGAARIAAIRETLEETGLAIAIAGHKGADDLADARSAMLEGAEFSELVKQRQWTLDPSNLVPFARWRPAHQHERIFDTRFYLAHDVAGSAAISADAGENSHAFWTTAHDMLASADSEDSHIIFPTRRNLERLAQFGSFADAVKHTAQHPLRTITPFFEERDGKPHLCIDSDLGYPVISEPITSLRRG